MKPRKRLVLVLLVGMPVIAISYWGSIAMRTFAPNVIVGPYQFRVIAVSNQAMERGDKLLPAEQVWITLELDPSDPRMQTSSLHAYLPGLLQNVELSRWP